MSMSAETRLGTVLHKLGSPCIGKGSRRKKENGIGGGQGGPKWRQGSQEAKADACQSSSSLNELDAIYGSNALRRCALGLNLIEAYAKVKRTSMAYNVSVVCTICMSASIANRTGASVQEASGAIAQSGWGARSYIGCLSLHRKQAYLEAWPGAVHLLIAGWLHAVFGSIVQAGHLAWVMLRAHRQSSSTSKVGQKRVGAMQSSCGTWTWVSTLTPLFLESCKTCFGLHLTDGASSSGCCDKPA
ncbi:uncharacterized protein UTRI_02169 [Ustilago trichophora]|uniref:Uncharacterized protein n=1 Tax=Ustilago trichophora TaxID=86804 RepID=A0A5C3E0K7_9BASI|nr:uncharacterized protein UTRI_02169 [Ustilago trichophora]